MSSGADCHFTEAEDGTWTYRLQDWPYGDNDGYTTYGPFRSFADATKDLDENHQNPGGYGIRTQPEGKHRHEFRVNGGYRRVGFDVSIRVESLGPDATRGEVIDLIRTLAKDYHPAFEVRPHDAYDASLVTCASCSKVKAD